MSAAAKTSPPSMTLSTMGALSRNASVLTQGTCQPPRNNVATKPEATTMCTYSAMKNDAKRTAEYSV